MTSHLHRKKVPLVFMLVVAALVGNGITSAALLDRGSPSPRLAALSNRGTPVFALPYAQVADLQRSNVNTDIRFLGTRAQIDFYTGTSDGQPCFLTSNLDAPKPEFSVVACLGTGSAPVPSSAEPLVDFSALWKEPTENTPHVNWLAGFAADDVAAVGVETIDGHVKATPVKDNIYAARNLTSSQITAIVALDKERDVIYRRDFH